MRQVKWFLFISVAAEVENTAEAILPLTSKTATAVSRATKICFCLILKKEEGNFWEKLQPAWSTFNTTTLTG